MLAKPSCRPNKNIGQSFMKDETSPQQAPSPLILTLFRILTAMNCGAILLNGDKHTIHLSDRAQRHLGEAFSINKGRLFATDRACDALFQTNLDQSLKYGERERLETRSHRAQARR